ncbi:Uncharacterized protein dnm_055710 [Desulfonema magnum]|uniref:Uncharacterized protein n=1 Tax=Desulfonema magnum TaxID=45655 RepID=A0A975BR28_9BACT|nr:Uncharacterized protein dnm_055710 [Desulfonema magnum]
MKIEYNILLLSLDQKNFQAPAGQIFDSIENIRIDQFMHFDIISALKTG